MNFNNGVGKVKMRIKLMVIFLFVISFHIGAMQTSFCMENESTGHKSGDSQQVPNHDVKVHYKALDEIQQLEVFVQHPSAHPLSGKSMSDQTAEDIQQAKTHYESRLNEAKQNLQKVIGSSMSVDSLLEQKKLLDEIQQLEVFVQHPSAHPLPGKSMSGQTAEDIQQAKTHYEDRLRELKKRLQQQG